MTDRHTLAGLPAHVWVMLGASTAGYALMLAAVTGLQARAEADLIAARQPAVDGVAQLASGHDTLRAQLDGARAAYAATVDEYLAVGGTLDALHDRVGSLAGLVAEIDGVSRTLPTSVKLPVVRRSVISVSAPSTSGTTGASGG
ncbi:MAG: hypothetical protein ABI620_02150 [Chloroflexota bacterium]